MQQNLYKNIKIATIITSLILITLLTIIFFLYQEIQILKNPNLNISYNNDVSKDNSYQDTYKDTPKTNLEKMIRLNGKDFYIKITDTMYSGDLIYVATTTYLNSENNEQEALIFYGAQHNDAPCCHYFIVSSDLYELQMDIDGKYTKKVLLSTPLNKILTVNKQISNNSIFGQILKINNKIIIINNNNIQELNPDNLQLKTVFNAKEGEVLGKYFFSSFEGSFWLERKFKNDNNSLSIDIYENNLKKLQEDLSKISEYDISSTDFKQSLLKTIDIKF